MKNLTIFFFVMILLNACSSDSTEIEKHIVHLEKTALERWNHGDVYGFLEISAEDVVYFDPYLDKRVDGLQNLKMLYEPLQGKIKVSKYEMIDPKVHRVENMAVLTFNLNSMENEKTYKWNCTEVYRRESNGEWKIIQTHWSYTQPELNAL